MVVYEELIRAALARGRPYEELGARLQVRTLLLLAMHGVNIQGHSTRRPQSLPTTMTWLQGTFGYSEEQSGEPALLRERAGSR